MRVRGMAVVILAAVALAGGRSGRIQVREFELQPPRHLVDPYCIAANAAQREVYIAGDGGLVVKQPGLRPVAGLRECQDVLELCYYRAGHKLYGFAPGGRRVLVYDTEVRDLIRVLPAGSDPRAVCLDEERGRLYVASGSRGSNPPNLLVYDCRTDSLVDFRYSDSLYSPAAIGVDPGTGKVYWCDPYRGFFVMRPDSGFRRLADCDAMAVAFNPGQSKVYVGGDYRLRVFDATSDSLLALVDPDTLDFYTEQLLYNPVFDKLYCTGEDAWNVIAIDCTADTVLAVFETGDGFFGPAAYSGDGRYYCQLCYDGQLAFAIIDCERDSLVGLVPSSWFDGTLAPLPGGPGVCFAAERGVVLAIDCERRAVTDRLVTTGYYRPAFGAYDHQTGLLYLYFDCPGDELGLIAEVCPESERLLRILPCPDEARDFCCPPWSGKLFITSGLGLHVLDLESGRLRRVETGYTLTRSLGLDRDGRTAHFLAGGGAYCYAVALDAESEKVVDAVPLPGYPGLATYEQRHDRVIAALEDSGLVVWYPVSGDTARRYETGGEVVAFDSDDSGERVCCLTDSTVEVLGLVRGTRTTVLADTALRPWSGACWIPGTDLVFCRDGQSLLAVDVEERTVLVNRAVRSAWSMYYNARSRSIHCLGLDRLTVIDCQANAILDTVIGLPRWDYLVRDTVRNRLFLPHGDRSILVLEDTVLPNTGILPRTVSTGDLLLDDPEPGLLFDASGRLRARLQPGPNVLGTLPAGVYFVHREADRTTHKVIIQR